MSELKCREELDRKWKEMEERGEMERREFAKGKFLRNLSESQTERGTEVKHAQRLSVGLLILGPRTGQ